ncbi:MAG: multidrug DMT transporter permease [Rikenellaceae bacterium]|nr:multidrug DMT transporter permease [Rikenellaceae bacterium]
MFIINSYTLAVVFCFITMLCWGSWGNTQKLAGKTWRYELFYWDYVIGMVLFTLLLGFTMGSIGTEGRSFVADLSQANYQSVLWVILGGVIFNASNILLSASTSLAGMAVAFPLGCGLALVLGVINNYLEQPKGNAILLALGVLLVVIAVVCNGIAAGRTSKGGEQNKESKKGVILAVVAGILMSTFYRFVVKGMDIDNFVSPEVGKLTPYSAIFIFSVGVLLSNLVFNTWVMKKPFVGAPVSYSEYFKGSFSTHLVGILGGMIWCLGTAFSYIAAGKAGAAVSYALGQGAPMIAAFWGVFIWKEFKGADSKTNWLLGLMFLLFIAGLATIVVAGN